MLKSFYIIVVIYLFKPTCSTSTGPHFRNHRYSLYIVLQLQGIRDADVAQDEIEFDTPDPEHLLVGRHLGLPHTTEGDLVIHSLGLHE